MYNESMKIRELDNVALKHNMSDDEVTLSAGTVGTVVHKYGRANVFEVEFMDAVGTTVGVVTLKASDLRPLGKDDMLYAK